MGILHRRFMKTALMQLLKDGKEGMDAQREDAEIVLSGLTCEQLDLHRYGTEQLLWMIEAEQSKR